MTEHHTDELHLVPTSSLKNLSRLSSPLLLADLHIDDQTDDSSTTMDSPADGHESSDGSASFEGFTSNSPISATGVDGTVDKVLKHGSKRPVTAIFVHAGAGYHSVQNEQVHLQACSDASRIAMQLLKKGCTAVEAVEIAVRILEDKEVTNAGFGSNLTEDGNVECDATIVDHLGRSGACGAVPNIKNPVSLAKLILDHSAKPMSLRRVPPNILVRDGAKEFAVEHGMAAIPNQYLVSKNAKHRYEQWSEDLSKAAEQEKKAKHRASSGGRPLSPDDAEKVTEQKYPHLSSHLGDHINAILTGTWNEGQADSPSHSSPGENGESPTTPGISSRPPTSVRQETPTEAGDNGNPRSPIDAPQRRSPTPVTKRARVSSHQNDEPVLFTVASTATQTAPLINSNHDGSVSSVESDSKDTDAPQGTKRSAEALETQPVDLSFRVGQQDLITDTVGAIAIDKLGNIAAASSSGGIGMKHSGRVGPAALVGIGTAVLPVDPDDHDGTTVAAVTSGTGEHMVPTMASYKCADRLYNNTRRGPRGIDIEEFDEEAIMDSFILDDFMAHPGVKNQFSAAAIGVMAVKKSIRGYYLYFSHNTDSFALASMSSKDQEPLCVMSRLGEIRHAPAHGARKISID